MAGAESGLEKLLGAAAAAAAKTPAAGSSASAAASPVAPPGGADGQAFLNMLLSQAPAKEPDPPRICYSREVFLGLREANKAPLDTDEFRAAIKKVDVASQPGRSPQPSRARVVKGTPATERPAKGRGGVTDLSFLPKSASTTKARQQAESPSAKGAKTPRAAVADSRVGNKKNARTENDRWERGLDVRNTRDSRNGTGTGKHTAGDGRPARRGRSRYDDDDDEEMPEWAMDDALPVDRTETIELHGMTDVHRQRLEKANRTEHPLGLGPAAEPSKKEDFFAAFDSNEPAVGQVAEETSAAGSSRFSRFFQGGTSPTRAKSDANADSSAAEARPEPVASEAPAAATATAKPAAASAPAPASAPPAQAPPSSASTAPAPAAPAPQGGLLALLGQAGLPASAIAVPPSSDASSSAPTSAPPPASAAATPSSSAPAAASAPPAAAPPVAAGSAPSTTPPPAKSSAAGKPKMARKFMPTSVIRNSAKNRPGTSTVHAASRPPAPAPASASAPAPVSAAPPAAPAATAAPGGLQQRQMMQQDRLLQQMQADQRQREMMLARQLQLQQQQQQQMYGGRPPHPHMGGPRMPPHSQQYMPGMPPYGGMPGFAPGPSYNPMRPGMPHPQAARPTPPASMGGYGPSPPMARPPVGSYQNTPAAQQNLMAFLTGARGPMQPQYNPQAQGARPMPPATAMHSLSDIEARHKR